MIRMTFRNTCLIFPFFIHGGFAFLEEEDEEENEKIVVKFFRLSK